MADAKQTQAAAATSGGDDQSMEEILQSIRRIIAEEGDDKGAGANNASGSDVLELTDMVKDDGSVVNLKTKDAPKPVNAPPSLSGTGKPNDKDVLQNIDKALSRGHEGEALLSQITQAKSLDALKSLSQPKAVAAPANAAVPSAGPMFRSGLTVEDLVMEALRPMLKDWLDTSLPGIVEKLVTREIKRITASLED